MTWKETSMESQKQQFILLWKTGKFNLSELCREFKISRPTGYKLLERYEAEGMEALLERSRRHFHHPNSTSPEIVGLILKLKNKYPRFGAKPILEKLKNESPSIQFPSESTVNAILKRHGLVKPKRNPIRRIEDRFPIFDPVNPNDIWSADFKGKFRMKNGIYCNPLTIADSRSRFIFAVKGLEDATTEACKPVFEGVFRRWGLPTQLHTDNGPPFGSATSLHRLTRFSVWLIEIGITPVYSDPGHPEQNGRHERMHRELKAETTNPPAGCLVSQQKSFDKFIKMYNEDRPHRALDMKTPSDIHKRSNREYPMIIRDWDYPSGITPKMVNVNGAIRWFQGKQVMISTALASKYVGFQEIAGGLWKLYYRHVELGYFEEKSGKVYDIDHFDFG